MSNLRKKFDAVESMRAIRDKLSAQIECMTLEEELAWLASEELNDEYLERLRKKTVEHAAAADSASRRD